MAHIIQQETVEVSLSNNNGVYLLQQNRRSEAASAFLLALWQLEATTGERSIGAAQPCSSDFSITNTCKSAGDRAKPSSYIFQREDYDEGLFVYQDGLLMTYPSFCLEEQLVILRYNMGQVYIRYKQYSQARRWFQTAWIQAQHISSKCFHLFLPILYNLAFCYYCLGENEPALRCYRDALHLVQPDSKERADTDNCIAVLLFHNSTARDNDTGRALELLQKALATYQKVCGPLSRQVATCLGNMGRIHFLTAAHELAMDCFHKAYGIRKHLLGDDSIDTAAMMFNFGQSLHGRGAWNQALAAYQEFFRVAQVYYKSNFHRDICAVQRAMAQVHRQKGERQAACILLQQAFEAGCGALGPHEAEVSCILSEMGALYAESDDYPHAIDCFLNFLRTQETIHQKDPLHPNILITKINLARVYKHSADYLSAFRYYKEVHAMQVDLVERNLGSNVEVASTLSSMGLMLYLLKAYKPALDYYQEALHVRMDELGTSQHPDVAETFNSIGLVLFKLGLMDLAKEAFHESIQLRTKLLQSVDSHDDVKENQVSSSKKIAVLLFNMGTACLQNGEDEQGVKWYHESLRVERQVLGELHPDVSLTLKNIAHVLEEQGDFEQANQYYREALKIVRQGSNMERVARLLKAIGNLHFMQGQVADGIVCFTEATRMQTANASVEGISATCANLYGFSKLHPPCSPAA